ncbi:MAG: four helix bundle protein [Bacteroidales bacterium]|nr:four helix bundle protein [Bacteroidales bacterium]
METQERQGCFFRFEELRIYAKATAYSQWVVQHLHEPHTECERNLINAFCNSSYDIAINIAEGSSRNKSQFEHYLKISKTAIRECYVYTSVAKGTALLSDEDADQSAEYLMEMTRMIGALIISLQRGRRSQEDEPMSAEDNIDDIDTNF